MVRCLLWLRPAQNEPSSHPAHQLAGLLAAPPVSVTVISLSRTGTAEPPTPLRQPRGWGAEHYGGQHRGSEHPGREHHGRGHYGGGQLGHPRRGGRSPPRAGRSQPTTGGAVAAHPGGPAGRTRPPPPPAGTPNHPAHQVPRSCRRAGPSPPPAGSSGCPARQVPRPRRSTPTADSPSGVPDLVPAATARAGAVLIGTALVCLALTSTMPVDVAFNGLEVLLGTPTVASPSWQLRLIELMSGPGLWFGLCRIIRTLE